MVTDRLYVGVMKIKKPGHDHQHVCAGFILYSDWLHRHVECGAALAIGRCGPILDVFRASER